MKVNKEQKEFQGGIYSNKVISEMFFGVINLAVRLGMYKLLGIVTYQFASLFNDLVFT